MRRSSTLTAPVGYGWHDHACWFHEGRRSWIEALVPFFAEGVERNERLLYVADKTEAELAEDLAELSGRDELLRSGQLALLPSAPVRGVLGGPAVAAQLDSVRTAADDAVAAGYRCLRLAAESAQSVRGREGAHRFVHSELVMDELVARSPVLLLCGYDGRLVDPAAAAAMSFVHPIRQRRVFGVETGLYADADVADAWRLRGELDLASREVFGIALDALPVRRELHLYLEELTFIDVAGVHALADLAKRVAPTRVVLHDPPRALTRILALSRRDTPKMRLVHA
ncbi:MEDS domain-containing protein [Saccharomonospora iraqiensis]|uniref:MEDS domain-containing protein n=1 Tax=Saccharomonospora iraqiensis TaxID=52698 RepID=UPI0003FC0054|nr:MEDS domain-containing protein [Saccharomonospora iraqiensis]